MIDKEFMMSTLIGEYIDYLVEVISPLSDHLIDNTLNTLLTKENLLVYFRERGLIISEIMAYTHCERYLSRYGAVTKRSIKDRAKKY